MADVVADPLEAQLAVANTSIEHIDAAVVEQLRRQQAEADRLEAAERERREARLRELEDESCSGLAGYSVYCAKAGRAAQRLIELGDEIANLRTDLGLARGRDTAELMADVCTVRFQDTAPRVRFQQFTNNHGNQLREEFPIDPAAVEEDDAAASSEPTRHACSVCDHEQADEIRQALAHGVSLREIEAKYGVSRSALSRHRRHA